MMTLWAERLSGERTYRETQPVSVRPLGFKYKYIVPPSERKFFRLRRERFDNGELPAKEACGRGFAGSFRFRRFLRHAGYRQKSRVGEVLPVVYDFEDFRGTRDTGKSVVWERFCR